MGKYINKSKGGLKVLGKRYKVGEIFTLTDEQEKRVSPAFLKGYAVLAQKKARSKKVVELDIPSEATNSDATEVKD